MQKDFHPEISVVIPMYNIEKYIAPCLQSLLAQSFKNFEVIAVDDCSKDDTAVISERMSGEFEGRMRVIRHRKNSGSPGVPRNTGLRVSGGVYNIS